MARRAPSTALLLFAGFLLHAQAPVQEVAISTHAYTPPSAILRAESNLVNVDLTVRDSNGRDVTGLQVSDFQVLDNGLPQTITAFTEIDKSSVKPDAPAPAARYVTFFFDDLHMRTIDLPFVKKAAREFAAKHLRQTDHISIATTSGLETKFTADPEAFSNQTDRLTLHTHIIRSIEEYQMDSINTLSALGAAVKRLSGAPGARVLVFLSSGFVIHVGATHDVQHQVDELIDAALHADVVIPAIDAKGLYGPIPGASAAAYRRPLREISQGSGGHLFENTNDLTAAMDQAANPEVLYQLAFNPGARDGKFHTLKVRFTFKRSGELEFRPGYLSRKEDENDKKLAARIPMDEAVFSHDALSGVPAFVALSGGSPKEGAVPVSIAITVDVNRLPFAASHGRHMQQLVFLMTLLDASGAFVTGKESIMELALTDAKLASLKKEGLKTIATLDAPPGRYQVRTVVREGMKGALMASTTSVELRAK